MNKQETNIYSVDDIHKMRLAVAKQYSTMTSDEVARDFMKHVQNAKQTMENLRKERQRKMS